MAGSTGEIRRRYEAVSPILDERGRRRFAATEARGYGFGGVSVVARVPGKYALVRIYPVGRQFVSYYLSNILLWTVRPTGVGWNAPPATPQTRHHKIEYCQFGQQD
jgi:hypothetical protein